MLEPKRLDEIVKTARESSLGYNVHHSSVYGKMLADLLEERTELVAKVEDVDGLNQTIGELQAKLAELQPKPKRKPIKGRRRL